MVEVVSFDVLAKNVSRHLEKGRQVAVSGHLEQNEWTAPDGQKRSRLSVIADEVTFLSPPKAEAGGRKNGEGV